MDRVNIFAIKRLLVRYPADTCQRNKGKPPMGLIFLFARNTFILKTETCMVLQFYLIRAALVLHLKCLRDVKFH